MTSEEQQRISEIARALEIARASDGPRPRLAVPAFDPLDIPEPLAVVLEEAARALANGAERVHVVSEDEELTTSEAAEMLGVSRPHLVQLLDRASVPYRMVGTHRRISRRALLAYRRSVTDRSGDALQELVDLSEEAGPYDLGARGSSGAP